MNETLFIVLLFIVGIAMLIFVPRFFISRAMKKVIKIFQDNSAVSEKNARTIDELGLGPLSFLNRLGRMRDYKPQALKILISGNVVQMTDDGRLFLVEDKLNLSGIGQGDGPGKGLYG